MFDMGVADPVPTPLFLHIVDKVRFGKHPTQIQPAVNSLRTDRIMAFGDSIFNAEFDNITDNMEARRARIPSM
jgi:hypothetical protein